MMNNLRALLNMDCIQCGSFLSALMVSFIMGKKLKFCAVAAAKSNWIRHLFLTNAKKGPLSEVFNNMPCNSRSGTKPTHLSVHGLEGKREVVASKTGYATAFYNN